MHEVVSAFAFAREIAGNNIPAKSAMIAITTSNSIRVNAARARTRGIKCEHEIVGFIECNDSIGIAMIAHRCREATFLYGDNYSGFNAVDAQK